MASHSAASSGTPEVMVAVAFPRPEPGDPEELSWALQTAHSMWSQGDAREAVRWLQRAALTATEIGLNQRGQAIAQLATHLRSTTRSQPPAAPGAQPSAAPAAPRSAPPQAHSEQPSHPLAQTHVSMGMDPTHPPSSRVTALTEQGQHPPAGAPEAQLSPHSAARQALRVSVARNPDGSFHVVPLSEGQAAAGGTVEALLVELLPASLTKA